MKSVQHCPGSSVGIPSQSVNIWWPESEAHQVTVSLQNDHTSPLNLKAAKIEIYVFLCPLFESHSSFFFSPFFSLRSSCHRRNEHQHSKHRLHLRSKHGMFLLSNFSFGLFHTAVLGVHATPTPTPVLKHLGANTHQCIYDCTIPYWLPTHKPGQLSSLAWMIEPDKEYHYRECVGFYTPSSKSKPCCCLLIFTRNIKTD